MTFDWHALYDDVKRFGDFGSDAQLAEYLGLTRAQISAWRTGKSDLGTLPKLKILDALGHDSLRPAILSLLPEQNRAELERLHISLAERVSRGMRARVGARNEAESNRPVQGGNRLLTGASGEEWARIEAHLTPVSMLAGKVLYEPGDPLTLLYLPTTAVICTTRATNGGGHAETAMIGREGLLGVPVLVGADTAASHAVVQSGGVAYRMSAEFAVEELARGGYIRSVFFRYAQVMIAQMAQTALCNRHHSVSQRFCRWLLMTLDRVDMSEFEVTQALIARMIGVRTAKLAEVARQVESTGAIRYGKGRIQVVDRAALEREVCGCYAVIRNESEHLFRF
ncbi:Crp/Fnr family transcriptional regulator [Paraburkholderia phytofirmans]|uniref:Crp/Fnr family transcriptional regulator n=1 Tax=Paraburkholderia phytofirmans TaxID=261302 RepID=A0ABW9BBP1_9BURK